MVPVPQQISASYQKLNRRRNCFPIHNSSLQEQAEGNSNSRFLNFRNRPGSYFMTKIIFPWDLSCTAAVSVLHANCTFACRGCSSLSSALPIWPLLHRPRRQRCTKTWPRGCEMTTLLLRAPWCGFGNFEVRRFEQLCISRERMSTFFPLSSVPRTVPSPPHPGIYIQSISSAMKIGSQLLLVYSRFVIPEVGGSRVLWFAPGEI